MKRFLPFLFALGVLGLLYAPMLAVAALSFRSSKLGLPSPLTMHWYVALAGNDAVRAATKNTFSIAFASTALATALGTALALGREALRPRSRLRAAADVLISLPVIVPDVIMAAALLVAFRVLQFATHLPLFSPGLPTVIIGHVTLQIAFVSLIVSARLATLGPELAEAARDLYASPWFHLTRVTLPLLAPAIVAGALLAFVLSLDDFVIAFFTAGVDSATLPMYIYGSVKRGISPELHALSTLLTLATLAAVAVGALLFRGTIEKGSPR